MRASARGFSLIELALGLVIVATLLSALLVPLATQMDQRRTAETQTLLEQAKEALLGFAAGTGRLPCPATEGTNGAEAVVDINTGACTRQRGFLPAATLGLSPVDSAGFQTDSFGGDLNRIRYAVSAANRAPSVTNRLYTMTNGLRGADAAQLIAGDPQGLNLTVCSTRSDNPSTCSAGLTLANQNVVAVVFSVGKSRAVRANTADEDENEDITPGNQIFVSRGYSEAADQQFDDILLWIPPSILISRLAAAGQL